LRIYEREVSYGQQQGTIGCLALVDMLMAALLVKAAVFVMPACCLITWIDEYLAESCIERIYDYPV
jgi:hypothetical protein